CAWPGAFARGRARASASASASASAAPFYRLYRRAAVVTVAGVGAGGVSRLVRMCQFAAGRAVWCGQPYTGQAVLVVRQGVPVVQQCRVAVGQPVFCNGPYTGKALVQTPQGFYAQCRVSVGSIVFCENPFNGKGLADSTGVP
ncbi:MAG: hypothetical protein ABF530_10135, partial [Acetobacter orientalis]|uniref:hypothetical protein n=1 Tax=Acetobacter orientalis TaxID=146474 RepID=UPI0039E8B50B